MLKYQIFISSTYEDLKPEREQVIKAILEMGHIPVGMEMFSAADDQQWDIIKNQIDQSDYYVILVANRYGSMDGNVSYTEKEYDYAVLKSMPTLGFVLEADTEWPAEWVENNSDIKKRLDSFRSKVSSRMVSFWKTPEDLYGKCGIALMKTFSTHPMEGWVRASTANNASISEEVLRLSKENGELRKDIVEIGISATQGHADELNQTINAMRRNPRNIYVWDLDENSWGEAKDTTLLAIFESMAPDLLDEASNTTLSDALALHNLEPGKKRRSTYPVPQNYLKSYIADLISLDLIGISTKRHSVQDTKAYWMLTEFGRETYSSIRKNAIMSGLVQFEEDPDVDNTTNTEAS